ncbi:LysR family transcriptional regulator [Erwinia sp. BC051422]|uniref:LysR family transcriptional regulator n=1 Tax=Erwinia wuhanensis TaxID=3045167 RepID=UPI0026542E8F|nr:LysR family transcriptional regulator [Erwinia sp. BC051422]MDN8542959.1 LysR family transcriptional regulator [Erwinia sp. BC051422]
MDELAVFLAVFKDKGFRVAAKKLGLSPSTVSERITALEVRLGVPLFIRTTRSVMPTEAGRTLAERMTPLLDEMRLVLNDVASSQQEVRGTLKLNVTGAVMVDILPPLLDRFLSRHPGLHVEIMVDDRLIEATAEGCDAGIRYGEHLAKDIIAVPIGPRTQRLALAAAPSYLDSQSAPSHPGELVDHDCIRLKYSSGALIPWEFEREGETVSVNPAGRLTIGVNGAAAAIDLARSGKGVIATFENWLQPHFATGELLPVLPAWWTAFEGPWLYFPSRFMSAPLRAFVDFLAGEREGLQDR